MLAIATGIDIPGIKFEAIFCIEKIVFINWIKINMSILSLSAIKDIIDVLFEIIKATNK